MYIAYLNKLVAKKQATFRSGEEFYFDLQH